MTIRSKPAARLVCAMFALTLALGGCFPMKPEERPSEPPKPAVTPLSDEQAKAQVVNPANEIARAAQLQGITGGFSFEACNDQGEPPYRGLVEMGFALPTDMEPTTFFEQIAKTMVGQGWTDGPPPGKRPFGTVIHKGPIMAIMGRHPTYKENGYVQLSGECRNMVDHRNDGKTIAEDITEQLQP
ncbi:MAG: hypothetical protein ACRDU5_06110 [Mycobacterium sp.]